METEVPSPKKKRFYFSVSWRVAVLLERPTFVLCVPLSLLGRFPTNECEVSDFCL